MQQMQQRAATRIAIQRTCAGNLLLRPRYVDFRRVLHEQHDRLRSDALPCGIDVRLENLFETRFRVREQPVGTVHLGASATRGRNAGCRSRRQFVKHLRKAIVQTSVVEVSSLHFVHYPRGEHVPSSLPRFAPLRPFSDLL